MSNYERLEAVNEAVDSAKQGYLENIPEYTFAIGKIEKNGTYQDKLLEDSVNIYSYIAKEFGVNTLTDARKCIEDAKVDPKIVKFWIDEGMLGVDMHLSNGVFKGYPEFTAELKFKISEAKRILKLEKEVRQAEEEAEAESEELIQQN